MQRTSEKGEEMSELNSLSIEELLAVEEHIPEEPFSGFIIVPTGETHDSGYGCMKFVLTKHDEIVGSVGGGVDVVHLNGIGGYGRDWKQSLVTGLVPKVDWSIDVLNTSKCVRVFSSCDLSIDEFICSDFEVFAKERKCR